MFLGRMLTDLPLYYLLFSVTSWTVWLLFMMFRHQRKVNMAKIMLSVGKKVALCLAFTAGDNTAACHSNLLVSIILNLFKFLI